MGLPGYITEMGAPELIALIMGTCTGWGLCVRIRVNPLREHAIKIETKLDSLLEKIESHFWDKR